MNRMLETEGSISATEDPTKEVDSSLKENVHSLTIPAQNNQEIWDTLKNESYEQ